MRISSHRIWTIVSAIVSAISVGVASNYFANELTRSPGEMLIYVGVMVGGISAIGILAYTFRRISAKGKYQAKATKIGTISITYTGVGINRDLVIASQNQHEHERKRYTGLSVAAVYAERRASDAQRALTLILITLGILLVLSLLNINVPYILWGILAITASLVWLDWRVLTYRISHGYFGSNRREALEIIRFVQRESDKIDFSDGGKPKKILSEADIQELRNEVASLLPSPAPSAS